MIGQTMKAIRVHQYGGLDMLRWEDVPTPDVPAGHALVKLEAIGVNFIDTYERSGVYKLSLPFSPGSEGTGIIERLGEGTTDLQVGQRVTYVLHKGSYAEYAAVPFQKLIPVPQNLDPQQVAAVILQGLTAHYLAFSTFPLKATDTALIHAAAGGTGALLVQIAKRIGATVIGTVSNDEKAAIARDSGADHVILYTQQDFEAEVKRLTDGRGVHVVYESVGKDTFDKSLNCLRPRGYLVLFGQSSGVVPPLDPQILNAKGSLFLTRPSLGSYIATREELLGRANDLFRWMESGELTVRIDQTFPLSEAWRAHEYLQNRGTKGKLLLIP
jgi:NADPH:quinone reductase